MAGNPEKIPIGISSCLLGEPVRFDGGHRYDPLINTQLADLFEFRSCCPEVAIGLGVPREPIQLVRTGQGIRIKGVNNPNIDVTRKLEDYGNRIAREFADICGYIFKARSPSCGYLTTPLFDLAGNQQDTVSGLFAAALRESLPRLLIVDEEMLEADDGRKNFLQALNIDVTSQ